MVALPGVPRREEVRKDGGLALADFLALPERTAKPRGRGVTHVIDRGLPIATLESLLEVAGAREWATVGLSHPEGRAREPLVTALVARVPVDRIIFEAPVPTQQKWFVRHLGVDVNLGNVSTDEVIALETLRRGLRADTAGLALRRR